MNQVEGEVYCEVHGATHDQSTNPYDGCPTEVRDGKPALVEQVLPDDVPRP